MKKFLFRLLLMPLVLIVILTGCNNDLEEKETATLARIRIIIIDENKTELYNKEIETDKKYLIDVLRKTEEIKLEYADGDYGAYITSLMGIDQITEEKGMYYWEYYVDDEYAQVGISNCKIKNNSTYKFVRGFYEL